MKKVRGMKGFTLIELMIVILIIAILVAIAVPVYLNARANAQKRTCQSNLRTIDGAIQSYQALYDDARYPTGLAVLVEEGTKCLKSLPSCPSGGASYGWVGTDTPPWASCPTADVSDHTI